MRPRLSERGRGLLIMIASPLLTLALGGVGWASIANPGVTTFLDILNRQPRFSATLGACEGGTDHGAPCILSTGAKTDGSGVCSAGAAACVAFDWGNGPDSAGACSTSTSGVVTCPPMNDHGLFDGGNFNPGTNPTPPLYFGGTDLTIVAHDFGVDPLGISTLDAGSCVSSTDSSKGSVRPCAANGDCPAGACSNNGSVCHVNGDCGTGNTCIGGEMCVSCGTGDPTVYTGAGSEKNGDLINGETYGTSTVPNKDDISNVYAIDHQDPVPTQGASGDTNEIFVGFERVINNGDSHMDLEFLQSPVVLASTASCTGGTTPGVPCTSSAQCLGGGTCSGKTNFPCQGRFIGHRSQGDLLLSADFTTGGTIGSTVARTWVCGGASRVCIGGPNEGKACTVATQSTDCPNGLCVGCDPQTVPRGTVAPSYQPLAGKFCVGGSSAGEACATSADCKGSGTCQSFGLVCPGTTVPQPCPASGICSDGNACRSPLTFNVNSGGSVSCGGWACRTPAGTQQLFCAGGSNVDKACTTNANCPGSTCQTRLLTNEFFEAGLDLAAIGFTGCINTFLPHTRSSQSFTATLKDFAVLQFQTCFPKMRVTKQCDLDHSSVHSDGKGFDIAFTGQVCNTGNVTLTIDSLTDTPPATFDSTSQCHAGTTLAPAPPGSENCCSYSGHYSVSDLSGTCPGCSSTDHVTATAHSVTGSISASSDDVTCAVTCTPGISVSKACDTTKTKVNAAGNGVDVYFTGNVCNTGNLALSGISVTDTDNDKTVTFDQAACTSLPPAPSGGTSCCGYSGHYSSTVCSNTDHVTATGTSALTCDTPSSMDSATCTVGPVPRLAVRKSCTDALALNATTGHLEEQVTFSGKVCACDAIDSTGACSSTATNSDVQLTISDVHDTPSATITGNCANQTLARGGCCSFGGSYFPTDASVCSATDTAQATGNGICSTTKTSSGCASCALCGLTGPACP